LGDNYDTYVAADVASALDVMQRDQIDVLLTDLRLGGEDGMTLIERALKLPIRRSAS
jgi:CheY-like chemotaxis protein